MSVNLCMGSMLFVSLQMMLMYDSIPTNAFNTMYSAPGFSMSVYLMTDPAVRSCSFMVFVVCLFVDSNIQQIVT